MGEELSNFAKKILKGIKKSIISAISTPIIAVIVLIGVLITYVVLPWITEKVNENSVSYTTSATINEKGIARVDLTSQELWKELIDKGYEVDKYLKNPSELKKLLDAELVTQLPDTRSDVTKEIDWENIYKYKLSGKVGTSEQLNVLFIGNSKTFNNGGVPDAFEKLANSLGNNVHAVKTDTDWGGRKLSDFIDEKGPHTDLDNLLKETKWDYIVLQEETETSLNANAVKDGSEKVINYVRENGSPNAIPIYAAWSVWDDYNKEDYNKATSNFEDVMAEPKNSGQVAYIASTMLECHTKYSDIELFVGDGSNPSNEGTYLAACCIYGAIFGTSSSGGDCKFKNIPMETVEKIQEVATETQKNFTIIQGVIKFKRHDTEGNEYYMTYVNQEEFNEKVQEFNDSNGDNEEARNYLLQHFTLKKNPQAKKLKSVLSGEPGQFTEVANMETDGFSQIYTSSSGLTYKDFKQNKGPWAGQGYNGSTIGDIGCGVTAVATVLSGLGIDKTPADTGSDLQGRGTMEGSIPTYLSELGIDCYEVSRVSASEGADLISSGKVIIARYYGGSPFAGCSHFVAFVDYDKTSNQFLVLDPYDQIPGSRWCSAEEFADGGMHQVDVIDTTQAIEKIGKKSDKDKNKQSSKTNTKKEDEKKATTTTSTNSGVLDGSKSGEGYPEGTFISSAGIEYRAYRQDVGSWSTQKYWSGTIKSDGCGPTSVAILAQALKDPNITPSQTASDMEGNTNQYKLKEEMEKLGMQCTLIEQETADDIRNALNAGNVCLVSVGGQTRFTANSHIMTIVDINSEGKVFVLNPNSEGGKSSPSGWYDPSELITGAAHNDYIITTYAGKGNSSVNTESTSSAPGYQAVVATFHKVETVFNYNTPDLENAANSLNIGMDFESSVIYRMSTSIINYEDMVAPYTLPFDFLWSLLVIGQSKGFTMSLADLAYGSDIEVSVYDNSTTVTNKDGYSYKESVDSRVHGWVSYNNDEWNLHGVSYIKPHEHIYPDVIVEDKIKNGSIDKTVITYNNTVTAALTKAHTWIADYDLGYTFKSTELGAEHTELNELEDQSSIYGFSNESSGKDSCEIVKEAINKVVKEINNQIDALKPGNAIYDRKDKELNPTGSADASGHRLTVTVPLHISESDVDTSNVLVYNHTDRVNINHTTYERTDTQEYVAQVPTIVINDKKIKSSTSGTSEQTQQILTSMDNFLFIGDSRYDGESAITNLGNNTKNVGVGSARIDEWRNVAQNGGRGTVQGRSVDITGNYSGISIQLGANSLWKSPGVALTEMRDFINALKKIHPQTAIIVNSCLPDNDYTIGDINAFNNGLKDFCNATENVYYVDVSIDLVGPDGYLKSNYSADGCHLSSSEAIAIFANNIKNGALGKASASGGSTRENFVSLFNKRQFKENKDNILSAPQWLFQILERNDKTKNMVEIVKFLLYKATGTNYGVTELSQSLFDPLAFKSAGTGSSGSGISSDLLSFVYAMEGGTEGPQYRSGEDYIVYYTAADGCLNVGAGVVVRFKDGSTRFTDIIGEPYEGQIVSKDNYEKMLNAEWEEIFSAIDTELAKQGVTFNNYQRDALASLAYNAGTGVIPSAIAGYKSGGNEGYWNATKDIVYADGVFLLGLQRRREQEYKLFTQGVYEWPY